MTRTLEVMRVSFIRGLIYLELFWAICTSTIYGKNEDNGCRNGVTLTSGNIYGVYRFT